MKRKNDNMRKLTEGHLPSFYEDVYKKHFDKLNAYAKIICNSSEMAKNVVSGFFYNLWENKTNLVEIVNLESYPFPSRISLCRLWQNMLKRSITRIWKTYYDNIPFFKIQVSYLTMTLGYCLNSFTYEENCI